jgi:hypothetical protein
MTFMKADVLGMVPDYTFPCIEVKEKGWWRPVGRRNQRSEQVSSGFMKIGSERERIGSLTRNFS